MAVGMFRLKVVFFFVLYLGNHIIGSLFLLSFTSFHIWPILPTLELSKTGDETHTAVLN